MTKGTCESCAWGRAIDLPAKAAPAEESDGMVERIQCRRYPPTMILGPRTQPIAVRPDMDPDDGCGEYLDELGGELEQLEDLADVEPDPPDTTA